jgi:hypothetical protein
MDIASVFEWFAQDSKLAAELAIDPTQREVWLRLALMWATAARESRDDGTPPSFEPEGSMPIPRVKVLRDGAWSFTRSWG